MFRRNTSTLSSDLLLDEALRACQRGLAKFCSRKLMPIFGPDELGDLVLAVVGHRLNYRDSDPDCLFERMDEDSLLMFIDKADWSVARFFSELTHYERGFVKSLLVQTRYFRGLYAHRQEIPIDDQEYFLAGLIRLLRMVEAHEEAVEVEGIRMRARSASH